MLFSHSASEWPLAASTVHGQNVFKMEEENVILCGNTLENGHNAGPQSSVLRGFITRKSN